MTRGKEHIIDLTFDNLGSVQGKEEAKCLGPRQLHAMKYRAMQYGYHVIITSPTSLVEEIRNGIPAAAEKYKETKEGK